MLNHELHNRFQIKNGREDADLDIVNDLSIEQKVGQIMMFGYLTADIPTHMETWIKEHHIGNIILFGRNITTLEETYERMRTLQSWAKESGHPYPLFISTDQENGVVTRLKEGSTEFPGAMTLGATWNPLLTKKVYEATGKELLAAGINMNLAPIVDVNNNPYNPVIGVRSFGEDVGAVTEHGIAAIQGLENCGVVSTIKHFPGHGDTHADSHLTLPTIGHNTSRLHEVELVPFKKCIEAGAPVVMIAHVHFPAFDNSGLPATVSRKIVSGLLREELSYNGLIMTDCMEMDAVSKTIGSGEAAVQAIQAGVDLILVSHMESYQIEVHERVLQAAKNGEISEARLNDAVSRIHQLKRSYLNWGQSLAHKAPPFNKIQHEEIAEHVLAEAVTLVRNDSNILPLQVSDETIGVIMPAITGLTLAEDDRQRQQGLAPSLRKHHNLIKSYIVSIEVNEAEQVKALETFQDVKTIIICTYNAQSQKGQQQLVNRMLEANKEVIVVTLRNPYDLMMFPDVKTYVAAYEYKDVAMSIVADILFGVKTSKGQLPVHIPNHYPIKHHL